AVLGDAPGSSYQAFGVCPTNGAPLVPLTAGGCVDVQKLDAAGLPLVDPLLEPSIVRLKGLVGHFSTWAVVRATPLPEPSGARLCGVLGEPWLPDLDFFSFEGERGETVT